MRIHVERSQILHGQKRTAGRLTERTVQQNFEGNGICDAANPGFFGNNGSNVFQFLRRQRPVVVQRVYRNVVLFLDLNVVVPDEGVERPKGIAGAFGNAVAQQDDVQINLGIGIMRVRVLTCEHHAQQSLVMGNVQHTVTVKDHAVLRIVLHRTNGVLTCDLQQRTVVGCNAEVGIDVALARNNEGTVHQSITKIQIDLGSQFRILRAGVEHRKKILFGQGDRVLLNRIDQILHRIRPDGTNPVDRRIVHKGVHMVVPGDHVQGRVQCDQSRGAIAHRTALVPCSLEQEVMCITSKLVVEGHRFHHLHAVSGVVRLVLLGDDCIRCPRTQHRFDRAVDLPHGTIHDVLQEPTPNRIGLDANGLEFLSALVIAGQRVPLGCRYGYSNIFECIFTVFVAHG